MVVCQLRYYLHILYVLVCMEALRGRFYKKRQLKFIDYPSSAEQNEP